MEARIYLPCLVCSSIDIKISRHYPTLNNGDRLLYQCNGFQESFSEIAGSPIENIESPISKIAFALSQSRFERECGYKGNADHVAAINILAVRLDRSSLWREGISVSVKQEPAENREVVPLLKE